MSLKCSKCGNTEEFRREVADLKNIFFDERGNFIREEDPWTQDREDNTPIRCAKCGAKIEEPEGFEVKY